MFLPSASAETAETSCVSGHIAAVCLILHPKWAGLLQLTSLRTAAVDYRSSPARAERLVLGLSPRDHVSSALQTLHWRPIYYRIQFKIAVLMHNALAGRCTSRTSWHLLPVTPVDSNYDQPPDPTSLFLVAEQSSAVVPSQ